MSVTEKRNIEGKTFGRLTVKEYVGGTRHIFKCECACGNTIEVEQRELIYGKRRTCGCYVNNLHLGTTRDTSGKANAYRSWEAMKYRCLNKNAKDYPKYGGRGISIYPPWLDFKNFYADMGDRPDGTSIGRIDNNGDYTPENCRWETPQQQQSNTSSRVVAEGYTIEDLVRITGLNYNTIELRLRRGLSVSDILETPHGQRSNSTLKPTIPDLGKRNSKLEIIGIKRDNKGEVVYTCKCDCGNTKEVTRRNFTKTQSCGCLKKEAAKAKLPASPNTISEEFSSFPLFTSSLLNKKFGRLTVIEVRRKTLKRGVYKQYAKCLCDCGKEAVVFVGNLPNGHTISCGCAKSSPVENPISSIKPGDRFGKLLVLRARIEHGAYIATCKCDCGNPDEVKVAGAHLKYGRVVSCGCDGKNADVKVELRKKKKQAA